MKESLHYLLMANHFMIQKALGDQRQRHRS